MVKGVIMRNGTLKMRKIIGRLISTVATVALAGSALAACGSSQSHQVTLDFFQFKAEAA